MDYVSDPDTEDYQSDSGNGGFGFLNGLLGSATNVYSAVAAADAARRQSNTAADLARAQSASGKYTKIIVIFAAVGVGLFVVLTLLRGK